jgi:glutamyl-tRNA synthetase
MRIFIAVAAQSSTTPEPASSRPETTRLAPSPTGALHLGNARTFLVNWALARTRGWRVLCRIEDLDGPRVKPGAADDLLRTLEWLGLDWDGPVHVQSTDLAPCERAMASLAERALAYPCELTRREIEEAASAPHEGPHTDSPESSRPGAVFPIHLRPALEPRPFTDRATNWRLVAPDRAVAFDDAFAGARSFHVLEETGDFVIWTKRGEPAYQLAVVVDDHRFGVTQVVRGDDLLPSTARQILLHEALGLAPIPAYTHLPLIVGEDGRRLAKRHGDTRLVRYRDDGVRPERVVGLLASWSGVCDAPEEMTSREFAERFRLDTMPRTERVCRAEDERWLLDTR